MTRAASAAAALTGLLLLSGCVVSSVAGATIDVVGSAAGAAIDVTGSVVSGTVDLVLDDDDDDDD